MPLSLNATDIKILKLLQSDASLTSQQIADRLHMSQSPCWRRINRLQEEGLIKHKYAQLDREKLGIEVIAFTTISLEAPSLDKLKRFETEVQKFPEVMECYSMAGLWDYILKIATRDIRHYEQFVRERLITLEGIREIHSHMAVTEIKNATELPLDTQLGN